MYLTSISWARVQGAVEKIKYKIHLDAHIIGAENAETAEREREREASQRIDDGWCRAVLWFVLLPS